MTDTMPDFSGLSLAEIQQKLAESEPIVVKELPNQRGGGARSSWPERIAPVADNPGQWVLVSADLFTRAGAYATHIRSRKYRTGFDGRPGEPKAVLEVKTRRFDQPDNVSGIYVRYVADYDELVERFGKRFAEFLYNAAQGSQHNQLLEAFVQALYAAEDSAVEPVVDQINKRIEADEEAAERARQEIVDNLESGDTPAFPEGDIPEVDPDADLSDDPDEVVGEVVSEVVGEVVSEPVAVSVTEPVVTEIADGVPAPE